MFKDLCVNLPTAVGRLLTVGILINLTACSSTPYYAESTKGIDYSTPNSALHLLYNLGKKTAYSVPEDDRKRHERCVFFAIENLPVGESCKWYSDTTNASGDVYIAGIYPNGCHVLMNTLTYKGKVSNFKETACPTTNDQWKFE